MRDGLDSVIVMRVCREVAYAAVNGVNSNSVIS